MNVADVVAEFLEAQGIRHVFGIVGAGNACIFDAVARRGATEIIGVHHEQAAVMAMQTYYRTSGVVTAALVTTGGGTTNAVTGVVGAWADSIPGLVIAGNENSRFTAPDNPLRMWGVQGFDSVAMVDRVTKRATRVTDPTAIGAALEEGYRTSRSGRPGPVWIEIPMDVQSTEVAPDHHRSRRIDPPAPAQPRDDDIAAVVDVLQESERPLLWLGHGVRLSGAVGAIPGLLDASGAPSLVSWAGADMVDSEDPRIVGRAGVYGQRAANFILQNCDTLLCIGTRLATPQVGYDLSELARGASIIVVDVDPTEAHKHEARVLRSIVSDAGAFVSALTAALQKQAPPSREVWRKEIADVRERYPWIGPENADANGFINSCRFLDRLSSDLADDAVIVTDMGTALLSGHQVLRLRPPQRLMTSTGLGEMGFGLPGAIGASFARDRGQVLCLNCDGGMMMNLQELQTVAHHDLPIKILVFNNDGYLMIKHTQKALFDGRYVATNARSGVSCPDFSAVAGAFGIPAFQVETWADYDEVIPAFLSTAGPALCEVTMDPEQPFVPKLSVARASDGSLVSPPLEDLSPLLQRDELAASLRLGLHPKSEAISPD